MHPRVSQRARQLQPFLAMEVMERAFAMERQGIDVAHLEIGEPGFPVHPAITEACTRALAEGETHYTDSRGLVELREAIAADTARRFGVEVDPGRILVTSGTSPAMLMIFSLLVEPGDEVLMASPHYPCYPNFVRYCGGRPIPIPTQASTGYAIDVDVVRATIGPRTRAIVFGSPANPTGAIQSRETLAALAELGVPLVSDEIYDGLVYDDARVTSALEVDDEAFVLDGFSKRFAMTGFRLGYAIVPQWALRPLQTMQQNLFISANRFVQHAGIAALTQGTEQLVTLRAAYARRRQRLVSGLRALGFSIPRLPEGAFYVLAGTGHLGALGADSLALAFAILERARVGATPGIDFGEAGEGKLRFCYAASDETIEQALERLESALPEIAALAHPRHAAAAENAP